LYVWNSKGRRSIEQTTPLTGRLPDTVTPTIERASDRFALMSASPTEHRFRPLSFKCLPAFSRRLP